MYLPTSLLFELPKQKLEILFLNNKKYFPIFHFLFFKIFVQKNLGAKVKIFTLVLGTSDNIDFMHCSLKITLAWLN